jgi:hypothetical protein
MTSFIWVYFKTNTLKSKKEEMYKQDSFKPNSLIERDSAARITLFLYVKG